MVKSNILIINASVIAEWWLCNTHTHLFNGPLSGTTRVSRHGAAER